MSAWWQMGGYAGYVWSSVGLTLVVLALNIRWARVAVREAKQHARRNLAIQDGVERT